MESEIVETDNSSVLHTTTKSRPEIALSGADKQFTTSLGADQGKLVPKSCSTFVDQDFRGEFLNNEKNEQAVPRIFLSGQTVPSGKRQETSRPSHHIMGHLDDELRSLGEQSLSSSVLPIGKVSDTEKGTRGKSLQGENCSINMKQTKLNVTIEAQSNSDLVGQWRAGLIGQSGASIIVSAEQKTNCAIVENLNSIPGIDKLLPSTSALIHKQLAVQTATPTKPVSNQSPSNHSQVFSSQPSPSPSSQSLPPTQNKFQNLTSHQLKNFLLSSSDKVTPVPSNRSSLWDSQQKPLAQEQGEDDEDFDEDYIPVGVVQLSSLRRSDSSLECSGQSLQLKAPHTSSVDHLGSTATSFTSGNQEKLFDRTMSQQQLVNPKMMQRTFSPKPQQQQKSQQLPNLQAAQLQQLGKSAEILQEGRDHESGSSRQQQHQLLLQLVQQAQQQQQQNFDEGLQLHQQQQPQKKEMQQQHQQNAFKLLHAESKKASSKPVDEARFESELHQPLVEGQQSAHSTHDASLTDVARREHNHPSYRSEGHQATYGSVQTLFVTRKNDLPQSSVPSAIPKIAEQLLQQSQIMPIPEQPPVSRSNRMLFNSLSQAGQQSQQHGGDQSMPFRSTTPTLNSQFNQQHPEISRRLNSPVSPRQGGSPRQPGSPGQSVSPRSKVSPQQAPVSPSRFTSPVPRLSASPHPQQMVCPRPPVMAKQLVTPLPRPTSAPQPSISPRQAVSPHLRNTISPQCPPSSSQTFVPSKSGVGTSYIMHSSNSQQFKTTCGVPGDPVGFDQVQSQLFPSCQSFNSPGVSVTQVSHHNSVDAQSEGVTCDFHKQFTGSEHELHDVSKGFPSGVREQPQPQANSGQKCTTVAHLNVLDTPVGPLREPSSSGSGSESFDSQQQDPRVASALMYHHPAARYPQSSSSPSLLIPYSPHTSSPIQYNPNETIHHQPLDKHNLQMGSVSTQQGIVLNQQGLSSPSTQWVVHHHPGELPASSFPPPTTLSDVNSASSTQIGNISCQSAQTQEISGTYSSPNARGLFSSQPVNINRLVKQHTIPQLPNGHQVQETQPLIPAAATSESLKSALPDSKPNVRTSTCDENDVGNSNARQYSSSEGQFQKMPVLLERETSLIQSLFVRSPSENARHEPNLNSISSSDCQSHMVRDFSNQEEEKQKTEEPASSYPTLLPTSFEMRKNEGGLKVLSQIASEILAVTGKDEKKRSQTDSSVKQGREVGNIQTLLKASEQNGNDVVSMKTLSKNENFKGSHDPFTSPDMSEANSLTKREMKASDKAKSNINKEPAMSTGELPRREIRQRKPKKPFEQEDTPVRRHPKNAGTNHKGISAIHSKQTTQSASLKKAAKTSLSKVSKEKAQASKKSPATRSLLRSRKGQEKDDDPDFELEDEEEDQEREEEKSPSRRVSSRLLVKEKESSEKERSNNLRPKRKSRRVDYQEELLLPLHGNDKSNIGIRSSRRSSASISYDDIQSSESAERMITRQKGLKQASLEDGASAGKTGNPGKPTDINTELLTTSDSEDKQGSMLAKTGSISKARLSAKSTEKQQVVGTRQKSVSPASSVASRKSTSTAADSLRESSSLQSVNSLKKGEGKLDQGLSSSITTRGKRSLPSEFKDELPPWRKRGRKSNSPERTFNSKVNLNTDVVKVDIKVNMKEPGEVCTMEGRLKEEGKVDVKSEEKRFEGKADISKLSSTPLKGKRGPKKKVTPKGLDKNIYIDVKKVDVKEEDSAITRQDETSVKQEVQGATALSQKQTNKQRSRKKKVPEHSRASGDVRKEGKERLTVSPDDPSFGRKWESHESFSIPVTELASGAAVTLESKATSVLASPVELLSCNVAPGSDVKRPRLDNSSLRGISGADGSRPKLIMYKLVPMLGEDISDFEESLVPVSGYLVSGGGHKDRILLPHDFMHRTTPSKIPFSTLALPSTSSLGSTPLVSAVSTGVSRDMKTALSSHTTVLASSNPQHMDVTSIAGAHPAAFPSKRKPLHSSSISASTRPTRIPQPPPPISASVVASKSWPSSHPPVRPPLLSSTSQQSFRDQPVSMPAAAEPGDWSTWSPSTTSSASSMWPPSPMVPQRLPPPQQQWTPPPPLPLSVSEPSWSASTPTPRAGSGSVEPWSSEILSSQANGRLMNVNQKRDGSMELAHVPTMGVLGQQSEGQLDFRISRSYSPTIVPKTPAQALPASLPPPPIYTPSQEHGPAISGMYGHASGHSELDAQDSPRQDSLVQGLLRQVTSCPGGFSQELAGFNLAQQDLAYLESLRQSLSPNTLMSAMAAYEENGSPSIVASQDNSLQEGINLVHTVNLDVGDEGSLDHNLGLPSLGQTSVPVVTTRVLQQHEDLPERKSAVRSDIIPLASNIPVDTLRGDGISPSLSATGAKSNEREDSRETKQEGSWGTTLEDSLETGEEAAPEAQRDEKKKAMPKERKGSYRMFDDTDGKRRCECLLCGKIYGLSSIYRHLRIHDPDCHIRCDVCDRKFSQTYNLNLHRKLRHGIVPSGRCLSKPKETMPGLIQSNPDAESQDQPLLANEALTNEAVEPKKSTLKRRKNLKKSPQKSPGVQKDHKKSSHKSPGELKNQNKSLSHKLSGEQKDQKKSSHHKSPGEPKNPKRQTSNEAKRNRKNSGSESVGAPILLDASELQQQIETHRQIEELRRWKAEKKHAAQRKLDIHAPTPRTMGGAAIKSPNGSTNFDETKIPREADGSGHCSITEGEYVAGRDRIDCGEQPGVIFEGAVAVSGSGHLGSHIPGPTDAGVLSVEPTFVVKRPRKVAVAADAHTVGLKGTKSQPSSEGSQDHKAEATVFNTGGVLETSVQQPNTSDSGLAATDSQDESFSSAEGRSSSTMKEMVPIPPIPNSGIHQCPKCSSVLKSRPSLIMHIKRHNQEKCKFCSFCNKGFHTAQELRSHERTHTGEKPFMCDICYMTFSHHGSILSHKKNHKKRGETQPFPITDSVTMVPQGRGKKPGKSRQSQDGKLEDSKKKKHHNQSSAAVKSCNSSNNNNNNNNNNTIVDSNNTLVTPFSPDLLYAGSISQQTSVIRRNSLDSSIDRQLKPTTVSLEFSGAANRRLSLSNKGLTTGQGSQDRDRGPMAAPSGGHSSSPYSTSSEGDYYRGPVAYSKGVQQDMLSPHSSACSPSKDTSSGSQNSFYQQDIEGRGDVYTDSSGHPAGAAPINLAMGKSSSYPDSMEGLGTPNESYFPAQDGLYEPYSMTQQEMDHQAQYERALLHYKSDPSSGEIVRKLLQHYNVPSSNFPEALPVDYSQQMPHTAPNYSQGLVDLASPIYPDREMAPPSYSASIQQKQDFSSQVLPVYRHQLPVKESSPTMPVVSQTHFHTDIGYPSTVQPAEDLAPIQDARLQQEQHHDLPRDCGIGRSVGPEGPYPVQSLPKIESLSRGSNRFNTARDMSTFSQTELTSSEHKPYHSNVVVQTGLGDLPVVERLHTDLNSL